MSTTILPSTNIPLPSTSTSKKIRLGRGLTHTPPATITSTLLGTLHSDPRKHTVWVEPFGRGGRYIPSSNDLIIGICTRSSSESTYIQLSPFTTPAVLPSTNFESSSKKTRPQISAGDAVYARVCAPDTPSVVPKLSYDTLELSCVSATTGKTDGLGPLKGGMLFDISVKFAAKLIRGKREGVFVLDALGEKVEFECIVGRNGKVWVDSPETMVVICVGRAITAVGEADGDMDEVEQRKIVDSLIKEFG